METKAPRNYMASFILDTRNYTNPIETIIERITTILKSIGCKINKVDNLGQRDFQRVTDRKFPAGIYLQVAFEGPSAAPATLKEKLKLDKTVNRILVQAA